MPKHLIVVHNVPKEYGSDDLDSVVIISIPTVKHVNFRIRETQTVI